MPGRPYVAIAVLKRRDAEVRRERVGPPPGERLACVPVDNGNEIHETAIHRDIRYRRPIPGSADPDGPRH